jgi:pantetheine-phosphate adenylyltransferase
MSKKRIGVYPGTFDPITNGHVDIIRRSLRIVDHLVVGVAVNIGKGPLFTLKERSEMLDYELEQINQTVPAGKAVSKPFEGLLMHFVEDCDASMIVRGLRAVSDFDYEFQMAGMNSRLNSEIEMVYLMASENHQFIASRLVKEIASLGGEISSFVPPNVAKELQTKFK